MGAAALATSTVSVATAAAGGTAATAAAAAENPKFVNVRPGLALGVITLQAGSRGPKLSLH